MGLRIKDRQIIPGGGYSYTQAETGAVLKAPQLGRLTNIVRKHRVANNIPIGQDLLGQIEQQICENHPQWCEARSDEEAATLSEMLGNFAKSITNWVSSGFPTVNEAEYERRKGICLSCEHWRGWREAGIGQCKKCGCAAGRVSLKLWMATEHCPLKTPKW